ncbi:alpha/beta fold hydrolase [Palleronia sp. KMU-117]|uniref:alpha/beta fold hydrolase n=1 Tax=Palleronia sp. KMU-117 TaxID=3434108 RepID=UPI003D73A20A
MPLMRTDEAEIAYDLIGEGPPVLLLHGFPQTRALWHRVAPRLARRFTVVTADLRGYGASSKPDAANLAAYGFRAMARDQVTLMRGLGFERFHLVGHDRGGRVAHRLALDHPGAVASLTVMDIVPTHRLLSDWNATLAADYWHWTFLAQPAPFPETVIGHDPDHFFEACLLGWGGARLGDFDAGALAAYRAAWRDPATIAGMCADYRAALTVDFADDAADLERRVACPALVLWGAEGVMARRFDIAATWAGRLEDMRAAACPGGHFFVDLYPDETAAALGGFLDTVEAARVAGKG